MATGLDQSVGFGMVTLASLIFSYYTLWVVILPFVDEDHIIHQYFLPQVYAVAIPIVAGLVAVSGLGVFIALVMLKAKRKTS